MTVFVLPPSRTALEERLRNRRTDSEEVIAKGQSAGFNRNQLFKNKDAAGVRAKKSGFSGGWTWCLANAEGGK